MSRLTTNQASSRFAHLTGLLLAVLISGCTGIESREGERDGGLTAGSGTNIEISDGPACLFGSVGTEDPIGAAVALPGGDEFWIFESDSIYPTGLHKAWILPENSNSLPGRLTANVAQIYLDTWAESQDFTSPTRIQLKSIPDQRITGTRSVYKVRRASVTGNPEVFIGYLEFSSAGEIDRHTMYSASGDELPFETPVQLEKFTGTIPAGLRQEHLAYKRGSWLPTGGSLGWAPGILPLSPVPASFE